MTSPALVPYAGSLGGYQLLGSINIADVIDNNTVAVIPMGCSQGGDTGRVGTLFPLEASEKSSTWRINGGMPNPYICKFIIVYHD